MYGDNCLSESEFITETEEEIEEEEEEKDEEETIPTPAIPKATIHEAKVAPMAKEESKTKGVYIEKKMDKEDKDEKEYKDRMIIRSYSSMILFIPSLFAALICGTVQIVLNHVRGIPLTEVVEDAGYMNIIGTIFFIIFSLNLILIAFDFNRARTIIIIVLIIATIAILLLVNAYTGFLTGGGTTNIKMRIYFSSQVYFGIAALLLVIILFTWIGAMFNYYIIEGNELLHHKGIGGGVERYPASDMTIAKEFPDIIELLIFRSGTLILTPPRSERSIILTNVIGINRKVREMHEILARLKVDID